MDKSSPEDDSIDNELGGSDGEGEGTIVDLSDGQNHERSEVRVGERFRLTTDDNLDELFNDD